MAKEVTFPGSISSVDPKSQKADAEGDTKTDPHTDPEDAEDYGKLLLQLGQAKIIPRVRKCNFTQFKNHFNAAEAGISAVDVLEAGSYLDEEIEDEVKIRKTLTQKKSSRDRAQEKALGTLLVGTEKINRPDSKLVLRIRIQSPSLLAILAKVMQESWDSRPRTFYRGFSPLIYFHPQVLEVLKDLEAKYDGREASRTPGNRDAEPEPEGSSKSTSDHDSPDALAHLRCYVDYISREILPLYSQFEQLDSTYNATVRFKDLWYLFRPGELVYRPIGAGENKASSNWGLGQRVWRLIGVRPPLADYRITSAHHRNFFGVSDDDEDEHKVSFGINCYYIDFTGDEFCVVTENFEIQPYNGERPIDTLKIFPMRFVPNHKQVLRTMSDNGRNFIRTMKTRHATYNWWTITRSPRGNSTTDADGNTLKRPEYIDSEVIVDFIEAFQQCPSWKPTPSVLKAEDPDQTTALDPFYIRWWSDQERTQLLAETAEVVVLRSAATSHERNVGLSKDPFLVHVRENDKNGRMTTAEYLTEEDMALLPSRLFAYVLRDRRFVQLDITRLGSVKKSADAFECLKIKRRYKDIIQSLVDDHFDKKAMDKKDGVERPTLDWIKGKGKGLFILFHGAPGVGKTATAEAVAQANGKPLFSITCGDLGLTPGEVEVALQRIFRLANTWDCVLLLDEVDTFFSQRSRGDSTLAKNALVSVFLRVLEYYDGLLFLTTNRPGALDEAFKSRIHLSLYYPKLDFHQTMDIWQLNIDRLRIVEGERCREAGNKGNTSDADDYSSNGESTTAAASAAAGVGAREVQPCHQLMQIDEQEILRFAQDRYRQHNGQGQWNGRQIRNAFQITSSLAHFDARRYNTRPRLTVDHFKTIHLVTEDFDRYMQEAVGRSDGENAFERGDRADHWDPEHARNQSLLQAYPGPVPTIHSPGPGRYPGEGGGLGLGQRYSLDKGGSGGGGGGGKRPRTPNEEAANIYPARSPNPSGGHRPSLTISSPTATYAGASAAALLDRERSPRRESKDSDIDDYRRDSDYMYGERTNGSGNYGGVRKRPRDTDGEPGEWMRGRKKRGDYDDQDGLS